MRILVHMIAFALVAGSVMGCQANEEERLEVEPLNTVARNALGEAMQRLQRRDFEGAIAAANRAIAAAPGAYETHLAAGQIRLAARDFEGARAALLDAVERNADAGRAWEMLGHAAFQTRRFREALDYYRAAASREESVYAWQGMGDAFQELYQADSAAAAYVRAIEIDNTFAPALAALAEMEEDGGRTADALRYAERALRASPRSTSYQFLRARLLVQLGRAREAIPLLEEIVHRDTSHVGALYNLGLAYRSIGQEMQGEATLERAARMRHLSRVRKPL